MCMNVIKRLNHVDVMKRLNHVDECDKEVESCG